MKATIQSTDRVVSISDPTCACATLQARVWEGVTESGVPFVAYITIVQVHRKEDNTEFERELQEHKAPDASTLRAIDSRFVL
ncbi:hypothetical protein DW352_05245 [Pseudolabrys taiwanensis]|uniref:Uncharacterized protein n=1 Tax=Pseudolabrys taiwanensis TaxID=331696 RepID=A0A345ZSS8_9HYPH|nr:hypothetical protein [Pseudolabrys taiwanensis]AXK79975.1 hypothetical protein DW352_05245 [Pseudolabrys taiwanensis]